MAQNVADWNPWISAGFASELIPIKAGTKQPAVLEWQSRAFNEEDAYRWSRLGFSVGLRNRRYPCIDFDIDSSDASMISACLASRLGNGGVRTRKGTCKHARFYRIKGEPGTKQVFQVQDKDGKTIGQVEVRGDGHQTVLDGQHPDGSVYEWPNGRPKRIATWPKHSWEALVSAVQEAIGEAGLSFVQGSGGGNATGKRHKEDIWTAPADLVKRAVSALPNIGYDDYDDWVSVLAAIVGSCEDKDLARELAHDWSHRWAGGYDVAETDEKLSDLRAKGVSRGFGSLLGELEKHGLGDLAQELRDEYAKTDFDDVPAAKGGHTGPPPVVQDFLNNLVYVRSQERFVDLRDGSMMKPTSLNNAYIHDLAPYLPKQKNSRVVNVADWWQSQPRDRVMRVSDKTYWPGKGLIVDGRLNTWRAPDRSTPRKDAGKPVAGYEVSLWTDLIEHVLEDNRLTEKFIRWCALLAQHPEIKPGWHWLIIGDQGIGKDLMLQPVIEAVGRDNHWPMDPWGLNSDYSEFLESKLIVVNEMKMTARGAATPHDVYNKLKTYLAVPPDEVTVNRKYQNAYKARNLSAWVFTSNEDVPLAVNRDDRRLCLVRSEARPWPAMDYKLLADWYREQNGLSLVREYLLTKALGDVSDLLGRAPWTAAKGVVAAGALDPVSSYILARIEEGPSAGWPDVMTMDEITDALKRAQREGEIPYAPTTHRLGGMLRGVGADKLYKGEQVLIQGRRRRVWALRDVDRYRGLCRSREEVQRAHEHARRRAVSDEWKDGGESESADVVDPFS